jgi:quinol monooxygenase YgiN
MIKVVAKFLIKKEKVDEVKSITKELIDQTREEDVDILPAHSLTLTNEDSLKELARLSAD